MYISLNDSISTFDDYPRTPSPRHGSYPRTHNDNSYPHVFNRGANIFQVVISISSSTVCMKYC